MKSRAGCFSFLIVIGVLAALVVIGAEAGTYLDQGPLLADVNPDAARLWTKATGPAQLSIRVGQQSDLANAATVNGPALTVENNFMGHVQVTQLQPATRYY